MTTKDGLLRFMCVDCEKKYEKKFDEKLSKRFKTHISSQMETFTNFALFCEKVFTHMNTLMTRKDSMKHYL